MPSRAIVRRRQAVGLTSLVSGALVSTSVLLAVLADPAAAADRIRPFSELVDAHLGTLRSVGTTRLLIGGLVVAVLYAVAAVAVGHVRRGTKPTARTESNDDRPTGSASSSDIPRTTNGRGPKDGGKIRAPQIRALAATGVSRAEIARRTGLSQDAIALALRTPNAPTNAPQSAPVSRLAAVYA